MKSIIKIGSIVLFLAVLIMLVSSGTQRAKWKGKIETENGITVIKNHQEPLYGEIEFELEEDLSIGREDDENYMFYRGAGLALDKEENIYALDYGNQRILKFDKIGQYLQTIGKKGQGPGEFESPSKIFIDSKDNIYIYDNTRRIEVFNKLGKYLNRIKLKVDISDFLVSPEGNIFTHRTVFDANRNKRVVVKIDSEGKTEERLAEFAEYNEVRIKKDDKDYVFGIIHAYNHKFYFAPINVQKFCYAHSSEYKVYIMDNNGNILYQIQKEEPTHSISRKEKNFIIEKYMKLMGKRWPKGIFEEALQFPSHEPFFDKIIADDKQRLYVKRFGSFSDKNKRKKFKFDIFSEDGFYLFKTEFPFIPRIIKNGFIYDVTINEVTGEVKIKRYKIKNWEQIKEDI